MYALAINGSPRKQGNTAILLNHVLQPLSENGWETELVQLGGQKISGCMACYGCQKGKNLRCAVSTDCFNEIFEKIVRCDALLIGTPTYFSGVTPETKALLDRAGFVALMNHRALQGKIGAGVIAVRRGGATHALDTINHMFLMSSMVIPGSLYWNMGYGMDKGEVEQDAEALRNMGHLGRAIHWLAKATAPVRSDYPEK